LAGQWHPRAGEAVVNELAAPPGWDGDEDQGVDVQSQIDQRTQAADKEQRWRAPGGSEVRGRGGRGEGGENSNSQRWTWTRRKSATHATKQPKQQAAWIGSVEGKERSGWMRMSRTRRLIAR
jgi:hypothetical protein